MKHILT